MYKKSFLLFLSIIIAFISSCSVINNKTSDVDIENIRIYEDNFEYNSINHTKRILDNYGKVDKIDEVVQTQTTIKVEIPFKSIKRTALTDNELSLFSSSQNVKISRQKAFISFDKNSSLHIYSFNTKFLETGTSVILLKILGFNTDFVVDVHRKQSISFSSCYYSKNQKEDTTLTNPLPGGYSSFVAKDYDEYLIKKKELQSTILVTEETSFIDCCLVGVTIAILEESNVILKDIVLGKSQNIDLWSCETILVVDSDIDYDYQKRCTYFLTISILLDKQLLDESGYFNSIMRPVRIVESI